MACGTVTAMLKQIAERVAEGETVTFRPTGNSMVPLIHSRDEVIVAPVDPNLVEVGDIVLTRVAGSVYFHLVKAIEPAKLSGGFRSAITEAGSTVGPGLIVSTGSPCR